MHVSLKKAIARHSTQEMIAEIQCSTKVGDRGSNRQHLPEIHVTTQQQNMDAVPREIYQRGEGK